MRAFAALLCVLGFSAVAFSQSNYASVSGKVTDATSFPITHATVRFKSGSNLQQRKT